MRYLSDDQLQLASEEDDDEETEAEEDEEADTGNDATSDFWLTLTTSENQRA